MTTKATPGVGASSPDVGLGTGAANAIPGIKGFQRLPVADRFWPKVVCTDTCWNWRGASVKTGYGQFWFEGRRWLAHRFSYEYFREPIPPGLEIDHLCQNKACVKPQHLEVVTRSENLRRVWQHHTPPNSRKTHCKYGHALEGDNVIRRDGRRKCRQCLTRLDRARRSKARAALSLARSGDALAKGEGE